MANQSIRPYKKSPRDGGKSFSNGQAISLPAEEDSYDRWKWNDDIYDEYIRKLDEKKSFSFFVCFFFVQNLLGNVRT